MRIVVHFAVLLVLFPAAYSQNSSARLVSMPVYLISADGSKEGIDGKLSIEVWVKKDGTVDHAQVVAGPSWPCGTNPEGLLADVRNGAEDAVKKARFSPELKDGKPQDVQVLLTMLIGEEYKHAKELAAKKAAGKPSNEDAAAAAIINGGVINGKALSLPRPEYPRTLETPHPRGKVSVEVLINENGDVIVAGAEDGDPRLQTPARNAACLAKFSPTLLSGEPVKVSGIITYNFVP